MRAARLGSHQAGTVPQQAVNLNWEYLTPRKRCGLPSEARAPSLSSCFGGILKGLELETFPQAPGRVGPLQVSESESAGCRIKLQDSRIGPLPDSGSARGGPAGASASSRQASMATVTRIAMDY